MAQARGPDRTLASRPSLRRCAVRASLLLAAAAGLCGCLTFDGVLRADRSGTFDMTYLLRPDTTEAQERARYTSEHVTLESFTIDEHHTTATLKARVDDITRINSAAGFSNVAVTHTTADGDERLTITITNKVTVALKDEGRVGPQITLTLPGQVREANRDAKIVNDRVTWSFTAVEFAKMPSVDLTVTYAVPPPATAPADKGERAASPAAK